MRWWLRSAILKATGYELDAMVVFVTLELQNTWANFVRAYYLSIAMHARLERGTRVGTAFGFPDLNSAIGVAVKLWDPTATPRSDGSWRRRDEPSWHDPATLITLCKHIGASNSADVDAAFSVGSRVFSDLPVFRNFCAHRNEGSQKAVQQIAPNYGIPATKLPIEVLLATPLGRPNPLAIEWSYDIEVVTELLCH